MYIYINENEILPYNGEILKRLVGKKLVNVISNPTDEQLKEFGYKPLLESTKPSYDENTQKLVPVYKNTTDGILVSYIIENN